MHRILSAAPVAILALSIAPVSFADTLLVGQGSGYQFQTIQSAVTAASSGDIVEITAGTYNERVTIAGKAITLFAPAGPSVTTISGNGLAAGAALSLEASVPAGCIVDGLAIQGASGPGVQVVSCSPTIRNCWIQANDNNVTSGGGGLTLSGSNAALVLEGCLFLSNQAIGRDGGAMWLSATNSSVVCRSCDFVQNESTGTNGGAIYSASLALTLDECNFQSNAVSTNGGDRRGGAFYLASGSANLISCTFADNFVYAQSLGGCGDRWGRGGAIGSTGSLHMVGCQYLRNTAKADGGCNMAYGWGGALWIGGGSLSATDCSFSLNTATANHGAAGRDARGGAILVEGGVDPVLLRCQFVGNMVTGTTEAGMNQFGGTLCYHAGCAGTITECTIAGSSAGLLGGGVFLDNGADPIFRETDITNCSTRTAAGKGGGIYVQGGADASFEDCRLSNCSSASGGGLYSLNSAPLLTRCVFDHNLSSAGSAMATVGSGVGAVPTVQYTTFCSNEGVDASAWIFGAIIEPDPNSNPKAADCGDDCNSNGIVDTLDIQLGLETDCDNNQTPDSCQEDCDGDGIINACEISAGASDCDADGVPDACQLAAGAPDVNGDGVLDSCAPVDFAGLRTEIVPIVGRSLDSTIPPNAICYRLYAEFTAPGSGVSMMFGSPAAGALVFASPGGFYNSASVGNLSIFVPCDLSSLPVGATYDSWLTIGEECFLADNVLTSSGIDFSQFSASGINEGDGYVLVTPGSPQGFVRGDNRVLLAQLTTASGDLPTGQVNLTAWNASGESFGVYGQGWSAPTLVDCNGNGVHDAYDIRDGIARDCDESGVPDSCEYAFPDEDCNGNGIPDICDIYTGASSDQNRNNVPDDCECEGDVDGNGTVDVDDIVRVILAWGATGSNAADLDGDLVVGLSDLVLVLNYYGQCQ